MKVRNFIIIIGTLMIIVIVINIFVYISVTINPLQPLKSLIPVTKSVFLNQCVFLFQRRLVEKLENMHNNALGDGKETCLLCGSKFSLKVISKRCDVCDKV